MSVFEKFVAATPLFGFILLFIWVIYNNKRDEKKYAEFEEKNRVWLDEQLKLPLTKVRVVTKSGLIYETKPFLPTSNMLSYYYQIVNKDTSLQNAEDFVKHIFNHGFYFHSETNVFVPVCEILEVKAFQEKL